MAYRRSSFRVRAECVDSTPHCRVVEQQSFYDDLECVDERIHPLDVRQFMGHDDLQLQFRQTCQAVSGRNTMGRNHPMTAGASSQSHCA